MKLKHGDRVKIKVHWILYKYLGDKHPKQGCDIRDIVIIGKAKGTDFTGSDYVVCKPELANDPKCYYGISKEQVIEVLSV